MRNAGLQVGRVALPLVVLALWPVSPVRAQELKADVQGQLDDNTLKYVQSYFQMASPSVDGTNLARFKWPTAPADKVHASNPKMACDTCHAGEPWKSVATNLGHAWFQTNPNPAYGPLGATLAPIDDAVRAQLDLPGQTGLRVALLDNDGPAARVGLKVNDILVSLGDSPLSQAADLAKRLKAEGEKDVPLKLLRAGKPVTIRVRPVSQMTFGPAATEKVDYYIGVSTLVPDEFLKAHVEIPGGHGLVVTSVVPDSPAEKAGVKKSDILIKINDKGLVGPETLAAQVQASADKPVTLVLLRAGKPMSLAVKPEPRKASGFVEYSEANWVHELQSVIKDVNWASTNNDVYTITRPVTSASPIIPYPTYTTVLPVVPAAPLTPPAPAATAKRLDDLDKELKALRQAVEEVRDALKKGK